MAKKNREPAYESGPQTKIILQPYLWRVSKDGEAMLEAAPATACRDPAHGLQLLDRIGAGGTMFAGAHLVCVTADPEAGDYSEPEFLGEIGDVPAMNE